MTILVTGGAGYIGSHLVYDLASTEDVIAVGIRIDHKNITYINCDIRNENELRNIITNNHISVVYHLAALKSVADSVKNPNAFSDINVKGLENILNCLNDHTHLIFASSCAVYGDTLKGIPISETTLTNPSSPYGQSKLEGEQLLSRWPGKSISLRFFNVAGKARSFNFIAQDVSVFPIFCESIKDNRTLIVYGKNFETTDGTSIRDYVHVSDVVEALKGAEQYLKSGVNVKNEIWNVCTSTGTSLLQVIEILKEVSGISVKTQFVSPRLGEVAVSIGDNSLIYEKTGWHPKFSIHDIAYSEWAAKLNS